MTNDDGNEKIKSMSDSLESTSEPTNPSQFPSPAPHPPPLPNQLQSVKLTSKKTCHQPKGSPTGGKGVFTKGPQGKKTPTKSDRSSKGQEREEMKTAKEKETASFKTCEEFDLSPSASPKKTAVEESTGFHFEGKNTAASVVKSKWTKSPFAAAAVSAARPKTSSQPFKRCSPTVKKSRASPAPASSGATGSGKHPPPRPGSTVHASIQPCFAPEGSCVSAASMINQEEIAAASQTAAAAAARVKTLYLGKTGQQVSLVPKKQGGYRAVIVGGKGGGKGSPAMPPPYKKTVAAPRGHPKQHTPERIKSTVTQNFTVKTVSVDGNAEGVTTKKGGGSHQKEVIKLKFATGAAAAVKALKKVPPTKLKTPRVASATNANTNAPQTSSNPNLSKESNHHHLLTKAKSKEKMLLRSRIPSKCTNSSASSESNNNSVESAVQHQQQKQPVQPKTLRKEKVKSRQSIRQSRSKETIKENLQMRSSNSKMHVKLPKVYGSQIKSRGGGQCTLKKQ